MSVFFAWKLMFAFKHFKMKKLLSEPRIFKDLPSVSVCIPARNETHAMTQCLERVIASRYPKLEIIVLDDSSGDNTSMLIKAFAHAGVRFVEGSPLPDGWLGKNHALQELLAEASGSYILYLDVDTQITPDTIGQLVAYAQQEKVSMVSVLPRHQDSWRVSVLLGTLRYFWELILHRSSAPAVASSAWMIHRHTLRDSLGGFQPYRNNVQPEAKLAAALMARHSYRFIISTPLLGISYEKKWLSQVETSLRLLFPILGGRIVTNLLALVGLLLLNIPALVLVNGFISGWTILQTMALWQLCIHGALYSLYLDRVWQRGWWLGVILWPFIIAQELIILIISINRYLRHKVTWKGRPITTK
ncbi:glycosyltransferase [Candidatus Saccharibacteria bacterium]|nr:glycosyltransferase [Candidatus Saccharibacteria bacterium]